MDIASNRPVFSTDNFCLAAFLRTKSCKYLHITKDDPKHAVFHFEDTPERKELTQDFWEGKGLVEPRAFYSNQKELKTLLYDDSYSIGQNQNKNEVLHNNSQRNA